MLMFGEIGYDPAFDGEYLRHCAAGQRVELGPRRRQQEAFLGREIRKGGFGRDPVGRLGFGVVAVGPLPVG